MKFWLLILIPLMAFSIGCGPAYKMGAPVEKTKLEMLVPGTTPEGKLVEIFGQPFKKEMVGADMSKYTYTYFEQKFRFWSKDVNERHTLEVFTKGGVVQKYDVKKEEID